MTLSRFFKCVKIDEDVYAVFNSLLMDIIFVSAKEYERIVSMEAKEDTGLYGSGIYVKNSSQDDEALDLLREEYTQLNRKVEILYFVVTTACNLRCKYCFEENNVYNNHCESNMSKNIALKATEKYLDYLKDNHIADAQVVFYGGEPLVNWGVVKEVVEFISLNNGNVKFNIVTNGTLIDADKAKFISKYNIETGISLDGPKSINDINRIYRNSKISVYDTVIEKIRTLKNANAKYGLSITISQSIIDHKSDVISWIKAAGLPSVFYNLYHYGEKTKEWEIFYNDMSDYLIESYDELSQLGIADGRINRKIDSFIDKKFKFSDCAAIGANQLTIKPNGDVIICQGYVKTDKYILGNIQYMTIDELINEPHSGMWIKKAPIYNENCINCEAIYLCGGGCSMQSETLFGSITNVDEAFCIHSKKSLLWLLKRLYKASIEQITEKGDNWDVES